MTPPRPQAADAFKEIAWLGFIHWAIGEETLRTQFEKETGMVFIEPARYGIAILIDQFCGVDEGNKKYFMAFTVWVTENYWGPDEDCPKIYIEKFKGETG